MSFRLTEYDYDGLTPEGTNEVVDTFRTSVGTRGCMPYQPVWITLQEGALIVRGEARGAGDAIRWPTGAEVMEIVRNVHQRRTHPRTEPTNSPDAIINGGIGGQRPEMAEHVQRDTSAMVGNEDGQRKTCQDGQHQSRGLRLVTGKNLNMQKFPGEQDKPN